MKSAYWSGEAVVELFLGRDPEFYFEIISREAVIHTAQITYGQLILALAYADRAGKLKPRGASILRSSFLAAVASGRIILLWNGVPEEGELHSQKTRELLANLDVVTATHFATAKEGHFKRIVLPNSSAEELAKEWMLKPIVPSAKQGTRKSGSADPLSEETTPISKLAMSDSEAALGGTTRVKKATEVGKNGGTAPQKQPAKEVTPPVVKGIKFSKKAGPGTDREIAQQLIGGEKSVMIVATVTKATSVRRAGHGYGFLIGSRKVAGGYEMTLKGPKDNLR